MRALLGVRPFEPPPRSGPPGNRFANFLKLFFEFQECWLQADAHIPRDD